MGEPQGKADDAIPRLGEKFFWKQFATAANLGVETAYVAMFDEVDEATAIFKVSNDPPTQVHFATYEGFPSDWYPRLTGEGPRLIREGRKGQEAIPPAVGPTRLGAASASRSRPQPLVLSVF